MSRFAHMLVLLMAFATITGCTRFNLYPIDQISIESIKPQAEKSVVIDVGPTISQFTSQVETLPDRIIVRFKRCKYCKDKGEITIENPHDLPNHFADNKMIRQVYPINEFAAEMEPSADADQTSKRNEDVHR
jgi:hypothetical protein